MTWGNHQPRTGLIEAAFQRELHRRLKGDDDWCFKSHDNLLIVPCIIRHPDGRAMYFNSLASAAKYIGCSESSVRQNDTAYGWKIEK